VELSLHFFSENSGFDTQSSGVETLQKVYFPSLRVHFFGDWRTILGEIYEFLVILETGNEPQHIFCKS
jgi:hypothetical protein